METPEEPRVTSATVRQAGDDIHIECRFLDGQKFAAVTVDGDFPRLAHVIAWCLNGLAGKGPDVADHLGVHAAAYQIVSALAEGERFHDPAVRKALDYFQAASEGDVQDIRKVLPFHLAEK